MRQLVDTLRHRGSGIGGPGMKVIALDMNFNLMSGPVPTSVGNTAFHYGAVIPMSLQNLKSLAKFSIGMWLMNHPSL